MEIYVTLILTVMLASVTIHLMEPLETVKKVRLIFSVLKVNLGLIRVELSISGRLDIFDAVPLDALTSSPLVSQLQYTRLSRSQ